MANGRKARWDLVLLWGFLVSLALIRAGHAEERDPFWQTRAGLENLSGVPLVRPDTWSWSGVPGDWYPNSPLWNLILGLVYQWGGFWGTFVFTTIAILVLVLLAVLLARRLGARNMPALIGLLAAFGAALAYVGARATLAVQILILAAVYLGLVLSDQVGRRSVTGLAGVSALVAATLSILGNWLHLSFLVIGPGLAAVWAVVWLLTPGLRPAQRSLLIVAGGLGWAAGPVLSPYGVAGGLARADAVQQACQGLLYDWSSPFSPNVGPQFAVVLVAALALAGAASWWLYRCWRRGEDVRLLAALTVIGVPTALAGIVAIRFLGISLITLAPVAAAGATRLVDRTRTRIRNWPRPGRLSTKLGDYSEGQFWRVTLTAVLILLLPGVVLLASEHAVPREGAILAQLPPGCRLFSTPDIGGSAVLLRPDVTVWMDGRADFFGRDMLLRSYAYYAGDGPTLLPEQADCLVFDSDDALTRGLRAGVQESTQWRLAAVDGSYELWLPEATG